MRYLEKIAKNTPTFPVLNILVFIFKLYHSKNMNKKLKFEHNMNTLNYIQIVTIPFL